MTQSSLRTVAVEDLDFGFDRPVDRTKTDSSKWSKYPADVLPLWVADMDFLSPQPIITALRDRIEHGVFGYASASESLKEAICDRLWHSQKWKIDPDSLVFLPGLVSGLNAVVNTVGEAGSGVMVNTPVYPPFLSASENQNRTLHDAPLAKRAASSPNGTEIYYEPDLDRMEEVVQSSTKLLLLCNPHNPVGRAFTRAELGAIGSFCQRHDITICADEIHCDLLMGQSSHVSIASLAPELASRTITLLAPSKTYNLPGLGCSLAVIPNVELRERFQNSNRGILPHVNLLGLVAAEAAYTQCDDWLLALRDYLTQNRDFVISYLRQHLPDIETTCPEATYLAWLDCGKLNLGQYESPCEFFLAEARVALSDGQGFGQNGTGFVRLNFGCTRHLVEAALDRMAAAIHARAC